MDVDPTFTAGIHHLTVAKQYATASWALAIYEYLITFDREVQSIWQRKHSFATVLWVFNRYTLLLSYCAITLAFYLPFTTEAGPSFLSLTALRTMLTLNGLTIIAFPGTIQIISNIATGFTLSLRVYALYGRAWWTFLIIVPTLLVEVTIESWAVAGGVPVPIPPGQVGCILTGKATQGNRFAAFWIGQLIFPSMIFLMTITRVFVLKSQSSIRGRITLILLRDGAMYFAVIFFVNLANVLTYVLAPPDIQAINAPFSALITAMMICRLMLNLRDAGNSTVESNPYVRSRLNNHISETLIGNLGEALDIGGYDGKAHESHSSKGRVNESTTQSYELSAL